MTRTGRPRISSSTRATLAAALLVALPLTACSSGDDEATTTTTATTHKRGSGSTVAASPKGDLPEELQAELTTALEETMATYGVPGAVAGVWVPGRGSWTTAMGDADIEAGTPADTDMTWPLRSVTKSYTVTLILQLADEGKLNLDDTIDEYVSGVTDGDEITLRQLALMSSGNADYTNERFGVEFEEDPDRIFTLAELNGFMLGLPAQFAPGAEHVYTNANTNLLGAVVEDVTGKSFGEAVEQRIIEPLGLTDTHYQIDAAKWTSPHPVGYQPDEGEPTPQPDNLSIYGPAGAMTSTLDDGRLWAEALATGSLLDPATQKERLEGSPLDSGPPYDRYALGIGETDGYWGHNGEGFGFTAAVFHDPETGVSIVVFMNASNVEPEGHPADVMFRRAAEILRAS